MEFSPLVTLFEYSGIPMIANLSNGFVVGLTARGEELCHRLLTEDMSAQEAKEIDAPLIACLERAGYFEPMPRVNNSLQSAYLHVTQHCNLRCAGCYSLSDSRNSSQDSSTTQMLGAIEQLAQAGARSLFFSGGEPFLRADLTILVRHAKKCGIEKTTVITNGTCLNKRTLEEMSPYVDSIAVSFDGYSETTPSYIRGKQRFSLLVQAVRNIQEFGIHAHIIPTIHRLNVEDLGEYAQLSRSLGVTMNYSLLSCEPRNEDPLADLLPDREALTRLANCLLDLGMPLTDARDSLGINLSARTSCGVGCKEISVDADGTVYPCHMLHRPDYAMGNIFDEPLENILQGNLAQSFASLNVARITKCNECDYRLLCGGGCRARSVYEGAGIDGCDPYCDFNYHYYEKLGASLANLASNHPQ